MNDMTQEELMLCLPYGATAQWTQILGQQRLAGRCNLQDSLCLSEKMAARQSSITASGETSEPSI
jgi:hypothetical protein